MKNIELTNNQTGLWYLGQVGFVFKHQQTHIAIDPYLSDYVDKNCSTNEVKWNRLYPAPFDGEELNFLDAVLCTHMHFDHADPWTLIKIAKANVNTKFIVPAPETEKLLSYRIEPERIIPAHTDKELSVGSFKIIPIPSAHEELHSDKNGDYYELGYILDNGKSRIFHAGDMCLYDGLIERLKNIDVAILPVNGRDYFRRQLDIIGNFTCDEAVLLAKTIHAKLLIPVHHDLYEINRISSVVFVDTLMQLNDKQRFHIFAPNEKYIFCNS